MRQRASRRGVRVLAGASAGLVMLLSAQVAWAAGSVVVTPNPVLVDPAAATSAVLSLNLTAPDPLLSGITSVAIQMTPTTGGIVFVAPPGCSVGPPTVISCPWTPAAAGDPFTVMASIQIAPGLPPQVVPVAWSVATSESQLPADEGSSSFALVDVLPTSSPSPTVTPAPTATASATATTLPTTVPSASPTVTVSPSASVSPLPTAPTGTTEPASAGTAVPVPTAVPAGEGPGPAVGGGWMLLAGSLCLVGCGGAVVALRR